MSQMLKSSGAMGLATLSSRVLGMAREILYANFMGVSWVAGAFEMAYMIPNLFRRLLGEGALTAAFIPIFKEKERVEGEPEMWRAANAVISGFLVVTGGLVIVAVLGISMALYVGTYSIETRLMLELLRFMFPYMLLACLAAVLMGMLNSRGYFFIPALGATMLNVVMIAAVLFLAPQMGSTLPVQIFGLAIGLIVAGIAQVAFQMPPLHKEGFRYRWVSPWRNETVRHTVQRMIPGMMGVAAFQINVLVTYGIAFAVDAQAVASFKYAVRLMELPQGIFGISLATYLLPALAGLAAEKKFSEYRGMLSQGLGYLLFVNLIASVLLTVLATPIIRLLFEHGEFTSEATHRAGLALACLAPGLVAFSVVNVMARAFYSLGDTQTPMKISVVCLTVNVFLSIWLIRAFREAGMGIANTLTAMLNVWLLSYAFRRKMPKFESAALWRNGLTAFAAALIAGAVAWLLSRAWEARLDTSGLLGRLGAVFVPAAIAAVAYWAMLYWARLPQAREFFDALKGGSRQEDE